MTTNPPADVQNLILRLKGVSYFPTATDLNAIQNLVARGYGHGWYQLCDIVYPIMGNTAASQSLELRHPAVSTFNLVYTPTVNHTAQGIAGDGVAGFASTGWTPSTNGVNWQQNNAAYGVYSNNVVAGASEAISAQDATTPVYTTLSLNYTPSSLGTLATVNADPFAFTNSAAGPFANALFSCWRNNSSVINLYIAGISRTTNSATSGANTDIPIRLLAGNVNGVLQQPDASRCAFYYFGSGNINQVTLNTDVVQYQTILGRA
jgi:hypothetical protein